MIKLGTRTKVLAFCPFTSFKGKGCGDILRPTEAARVVLTTQDPCKSWDTYKHKIIDIMQKVLYNKYIKIKKEKDYESLINKNGKI